MLTVSLARASGRTGGNVTLESCRESEKLFLDVPPISILPARERTGIIEVVLPDLRLRSRRNAYWGMKV